MASLHLERRQTTDIFRGQLGVSLSPSNWRLVELNRITPHLLLMPYVEPNHRVLSIVPLTLID